MQFLFTLEIRTHPKNLFLTSISDWREIFAELFLIRIGKRQPSFEDSGWISTLLNSLEHFFESYPHIPGVDPREQFQTNEFPALFESEVKD